MPSLISIAQSLVHSVQCSLFVWGFVLFLSFHLVIFCVTLVACAINTTRPHCTLYTVTHNECG